MIHPPKIKKVFVTVLMMALSTGGAIAGVTSNSAPEWTLLNPQAVAALPPPPDTGTPDGQRIPGGTRPELTGACKQTDQPLTALVPEGGKGLTTAEHPVFWFYVPYAPKDIHSIEFSLHNRQETATLYRTALQLTKTRGVVGIPLPPISKHSLNFNESYHWYFVVKCKPTKTFENDVVLDGWVTRVQQSLDSDNQFNVIWYDELTNSAKRYLSEPQNIGAKNAWVNLLQSVGLAGLAQAPLNGSGISLKN